MLEWFFISFDFVFVVTFNLFPEKKFPIIWSKRKRRTDDGIESITNCLYVKCNAKNTTTSKKIMNYKKWLFIAGFLYSLFRYGLGIFFREMKRCRKLHFFLKMHSWRLLSCCKAFFLEFYQIFLFYIPVRNEKLHTEANVEFFNTKTSKVVWVNKHNFFPKKYLVDIYLQWFRSWM